MVYPSAFFHKKSFTGNGEPHMGLAVSFIFEEGSKGAAAVSVREEEGGITSEQDVEEDEEREMGRVKVCGGVIPSSSSFMSRSS